MKRQYSRVDILLALESAHYWYCGGVGAIHFLAKRP